MSKKNEINLKESNESLHESFEYYYRLVKIVVNSKRLKFITKVTLYP